ncbi:MAG TPA: HPr kinase/phosphorylase [Caulobacteraceae bacterium]|nr:HPr kinase/phosphorylase [Caulobacteraceae bacterium]
MIRHGGLIGAWIDGAWRGALIEGPSGAGKSDLALRAMADGWRLAADDRVVVWESGGVLFGRAPDPLSGLMETRGMGVGAAAAPTLAYARIELKVTCVDAPASVERLPDPASERIAGVEIPAWDVWAFDVAACAKLRRVIETLGRWRDRAYLAPLPPQTQRGVRGFRP